MDFPPQDSGTKGASSLTKKRKIDTVEGSCEEASSEMRPNPKTQYLRILVVHIVHCGGSGAHVEHEDRLTYLDRPRLFAGDHKASILKGERKIEDLDEYMEQHEEFSVLVRRYYSCQAHLRAVDDLFQRLQLPHQNVTVTSKIRPYLFSLAQNSEEAMWEFEEMKIVSGSLTRTLSNFGMGYTTMMKAPYVPFYHRRQIVGDFLRSPKGSHDKELKSLASYIDYECGDNFDEADDLFSKGLVSFKHFDKLFKSDDIVVMEVKGQQQAYACTRVMSNDINEFSMDCMSWIFDGNFRQKHETFSAEWPENADIMRIQDLKVFPLRFVKDGTREHLKERGIKFWGFRTRKYVGYLSDSIESDSQTVSSCITSTESRLELTVNKLKPRYMIDMRTYHELHQKEHLNTPEIGEAIPMSEGGSVPDDSFLLLLPAIVLGFGLHDKKWSKSIQRRERSQLTKNLVNLIVDKIEDIEWNSRAFGKLVLGHQKKEIIKALVTVHVASGKKPTTDIIEGKGNGLIMLLHGSPGTGKTLTAESIAEFTKKPLYRVTCGDIGTDPETVEKYLESVLYIGTVWGCVVLLDEADVFLEERSQSDLQRNALVSVFLRVLEYYDGILILTSNRVGTFDEAFKSRIQLAIHYPRLDTAGRSKIWYGFIDDLEKRGLTEDPAILRSSVPALADKPLNGRQIRNTVKNARQYAEYKKEPLNTEHFEAVVEVANEFEEYLKRIVDHTEQASFLGTRAPE